MKRWIPYACVLLLALGSVAAAVLSVESRSSRVSGLLQLALPSSAIPVNWGRLDVIKIELPVLSRSSAPCNGPAEAGLYSDREGELEASFEPFSPLSSRETLPQLMYSQWSTRHVYDFTEVLGRTALTTPAEVLRQMAIDFRAAQRCFEPLIKGNLLSETFSFKIVRADPAPSLHVPGLVSSSKFGARGQVEVMYTFLGGGVFATISYIGPKVTPEVVAVLRKAAQRLWVN